MQVINSETMEMLYDSRWRFPELLGYKKGTPEYEALQKMWEKRTGKKIPKEEEWNREN